MSDRDLLGDLPSVDRLATAVARAELQARREELLNGADAGAEETVDLVTRGDAPAPATRAQRDRRRRLAGQLIELLAGEPPVRRPVRAGSALTAFSGSTSCSRPAWPALLSGAADRLADDVRPGAAALCAQLDLEGRLAAGSRAAPASGLPSSSFTRRLRIAPSISMSIGLEA